jgi:hypothetical protein
MRLTNALLLVIAVELAGMVAILYAVGHSVGAF